MATRNIVPRANNEGGLGTSSKKWANVWSTLVNALTLTAQATGFTVAGGTTSKTLTVDETVALSDKAPKLLTGYTSGAGTVAATDSVLQAIQKLNGNYVQGLNAVRPSFLAYLSSTQSDQTGDGTSFYLLFDTEVYDQAANYNPATGLFAAPVTGKYNFYAMMLLQGLAANHTTITLNIITSNRAYYVRDYGSVAVNRNLYLTVLGADMDAGDTAAIAVTATGGSKVVDVYGTTTPNSWFCGHLVC